MAIAKDTSIDTSTKRGFKEVYDMDAVINALKAWVASYPGDYVDEPYRGGKVMPLLMKPMKQVDAQDIRSSIQSHLTEEFQPTPQIRQFNVEPDYERRLWRFDMTVFFPSITKIAKVNTYVRGR